MPGYRLAFGIAFAVMALYLAVVLVSSPGSAKGDEDYGKSHETHSNNGSETKSRPH